MNKLLRRSRIPKQAVVFAVEARLASFIIDTEHIEDCRCGICWARFQNQWVRGNENEIAIPEGVQGDGAQLWDAGGV